MRRRLSSPGAAKPFAAPVFFRAAALLLALSVPLPPVASAEPFRLAIAGRDSVRVELFRSDGGSCDGARLVPVADVHLGLRTPELTLEIPDGSGPLTALVTGPLGGPCSAFGEEPNRGLRQIRFLRPPREASVRGTAIALDGKPAAGILVRLDRVSATPCSALRTCPPQRPEGPPASAGRKPESPATTIPAAPKGDRRVPAEGRRRPGDPPDVRDQALAAARLPEPPPNRDFPARTMRTAEDGRFRFDRLPAGEYRLALHPDAQRPARRGRVVLEDGVSLDLGAVATGVAPGAGELRGRIDGPSDGLGEQVFLSPLDRQRGVPKPVLVSPSGRFEFPAVPAGRWQVEWRKDAVPRRRAVARVFEDERTDVALADEPIRLSGVVTRGVSGLPADVCAFDDDGLAAPCATSGPDGRFSIEMAAPERAVRLVARSRGREAGIAEEVVAAAALGSSVSIDVPPGGQAIRFVFADGLGAKDAVVTIFRSREEFATLRTDSSGLVLLPSTLPGGESWRYRLTTAGGDPVVADERLPLLFGAASAVFVELPLPILGERRIRLHDETGAPSPGGTLLLRDRGTLRRFRADDTGRALVDVPTSPEAEAWMVDRAVGAVPARRVPFGVPGEERFLAASRPRHRLELRFRDGGPVPGVVARLHRLDLPDDVAAASDLVDLRTLGSGESGLLTIPDLLEGEWEIRPESPGRTWPARIVELARDTVLDFAAEQP